jgi:hypothetical protein
MERRWNDIDREKQDSEKHLSQCHFSTRNTTWIVLGVKPGLRSEKLATNRLCNDTAYNKLHKVGKHFKKALENYFLLH